MLTFVQSYAKKKLGHGILSGSNFKGEKRGLNVIGTQLDQNTEIIAGCCYKDV